MARYHKVNFEQAKKIIDTDENCIFIDVREEDEYELEHAEGAAFFPLSEMDKERCQEVIPDKNTAVVLYCKSGMRSRQAADYLLSQGYQRVYDIGAIGGWPYGYDFGF